MARFETLVVKQVRRETPDCVSIALDVPAALRDSFQFLPGQYVTLRKDFNGEEVRRSYSICSAPSEQVLRIGVKEVPNGQFSAYANRVLQPGDALDVMPPLGKFIVQANTANKKNYVAFAAGSGITPILSIMKTVLETEPKSQFTLFYGNRQKASIIFREEIEYLKNVYTERLSIFHILSGEELGAELFSGRIDKNRVKRLAALLFDAQSVDDYYLCGPEPMIHAVRDVLEEKGVDKTRIHFELFTSATKLQAGAGTEKPKAQEGQSFKSAVKVIMDGDEFEFSLQSDGKTILDAAMASGIDVPFSCKGAVCCTCLARVKEGEVVMEKNYSLTDKEVADGLILTCQAHPKTANVTVDYDDIW